MRAFIIGNGFDLAHGMKTSYLDFYNYIKSNYSDMNSDVMFVPTPVTAPDGDEVVNETDAVSLLCHLIEDACGGDWSDFESALGKINLFECFDDLKEVYDRDGDRNLWHEAYNNEDRMSDLNIVFPIIRSLFSDWIETIKVSKHGFVGFSNLIDRSSDLFISFNYTHTLEELYGCKNVIHMHGEAGNGRENIIFGHNGNIDYSENNPRVPVGCYNNLQELYDLLRKPTGVVITEHHRQLKILSECSEIYSIGFSYSDVDLPYIKEMCNIIKENSVKWIFDDYNSKSTIKRFQKKVKACGFAGGFSTFSIY